MKTTLVFLLATLLFTDLDKIGKINSAKAEAKKAFLSGEFTTAIKKYTYLIDSLGVNEDEVRANLASAYFQANDTTGALNNYQRLTQSANKKISSVANQQLGVMANNQEKLEESLNYFKQALKAAPENDEARYNYEIVKKKLEEKKKQDQQKNKDQKDQDKKDDQKKDQKDQQKDKKDQEKKDQEKKDQEKKDQDKKDQEKKDQDKKDQKEKDPKDQKEKEQKEKEQKEKEEQEKNKDKKDIPPSVSEKLKEMQMSEEKAKMILEAMKNQEVQYLQQNKRKATKPKDKGKPDW
ncbi:MAG: tetratricopeptide repeat protein [Cyclobacteriaceae bacterium]